MAHPAPQGHLAIEEEAVGLELKDPIAMEIFANRLLSITEDMGTTLVRSSFSTNIKERKDCSVSLFDAAGRLIAQASHVPLQLGSLLGGVEAVLASRPILDIIDGDTFVCNDPYLAGGTHTPDIAIITPVFINGTLRFFAANIAHHSDVGGSVPGSVSGSSRTIFEEGLRIPVIRLSKAGILDEELLNLIAQNSRDPGERKLDLKVQIAANLRGADLMRKLVQTMGIDPLLAAVEDLLNYTAQRMRNRLRARLGARASCIAYMDDDGVEDCQVAINATVSFTQNKLFLDFEGSSPQTRGAMNVSESALRATVCYAVKALLDPELLPNSGMFEGIEIRAPVGSVVNPMAPAAVGARSITCNKVARAIFGAFAKLLPPERVMAASHDAVPAIIFSGKRRGSDETFVYLETIGGGVGAGFDRDGMDAVQVHVTNTSNLPIEALEMEFPLIVEAYALAEDSGGSGRKRGGLGIVREIRAAGSNIVFTARSDNHKNGAPGFDGGSEGGLARLTLNPGTDHASELFSKISGLELPLGQSVRIQTGGGGGFGSPGDRIPVDLHMDISSGKLSLEQALRDYGPALVAAALAETVVRERV
jgi:N-methylhydantoinase B